MKNKLLSAVVLSLSFLSIGTVPQYVSAGGGNNDVEEFFTDPKTHLQFSQIYETDGELKVRIKGQQGDKSELIDKTLIANEIGWAHSDEAVPPYSSKIYKTQLLLGMQMTNFNDHISETRTLHQAGREFASEDQVPTGQWGNMYKDKTYIRPDTTEHVVKAFQGQYKLQQHEQLVEADRKFWDGTSYEKLAFRGINTHMQTRYNNFEADVYKTTLVRYERETPNAAEKLISEEVQGQVLKNKRNRGDEPTKAAYQASWS